MARHKHLTHVRADAPAFVGEGIATYHDGQRVEWSTTPEPGGTRAGAAEQGSLANAGTTAYHHAPSVAYPGYASGVALVTLPDGSEHTLDLVAICGAQAALELARVALEGRAA